MTRSAYEWPSVPGTQRRDAQFDFSGGENSVTDKALLKENEANKLSNLFSSRGGGLTVRRGHKSLLQAAHAGRMVTEFEQSSGQILTYLQFSATFYDETMMPRYVFFPQAVAINDAVYLGARAKFNEFVMLAITAYANPGAGATFVWEISNGSGGWIDKTAQINASIANSKQMRGVAGEWTFSWPVFSDWLPDVVNGGAYLYWIRIRCTLGGAEAVAVVQSQRRIRGDWLGQRKIAVATTGSLYECVVFNTSMRLVESWTTTNRLDRVGGAAMNDYFYYHSDGQRALRRWNGCRGVTRSGFNNAPAPAGLAAPVAPTLNAPVGGLPAGYNNGVIIRYRLAYLYGPDGILGEGPVGPTVEQVFAGAGQWQANVNLLNAINNAGALDVWGLKLYATNDLVGVDPSERDQVQRYMLIATILRDDATWVATVFVDTKTPRAVSGQATPISYANLPPFYPKGVTTGGERLWIWDEHFVAASDIRAGDSWNPDNTFKYQRVVGCWWWQDAMLVFTPERIYAIQGINTGAPYQTILFAGFGCVQSESIVEGDGYLYFMTRLGPARLGPQGVELLALGRVFESPNYWSGIAAERRKADAVYFNHRYWIPVDNGSDKDGTNFPVAVYDMFGGGWSYLGYVNGATQLPWGTLSVVHAPLEHALADQLVLVGFPDTATNLENQNLCLLEYGTTDRWTTFQYDGTPITFQLAGRGLAMGALERTKEYRRAHVRVRFQAHNVNLLITALLLGDILSAPSKSATSGPNAVSPFYVDFRFEPGPSMAPPDIGGYYFENCPQFYVSGDTDMGADIIGWWIEAEVLDFETGWKA